MTLLAFLQPNSLNEKAREQCGLFLTTYTIDEFYVQPFICDGRSLIAEPGLVPQSIAIPLMQLA